MAPQDAFRSLPPEIRAMALAGHYLQSFALMEAQLNDTIASALKLDTPQKLIVCKNIQFRDKQKIIRTLVSSSFMPPAEKAEYDKLLIRMGELSNDRNMVAHDLFLAPEKEGDIEFLVTKATGKLQFPETVWTVDEVEQKCDELAGVQGKLKALSGRLSYADVIRALVEQEDRKARGIALEQMPISALFGLVPPDQGSHLPPSDPESHPQETTNATTLETPQEPLE
ncbi:hypothetical protein [Devosia sp.]|uniref:hypothetical protein n=1 Tax=Devosia sp. TaxID=1871048 RepID=UPI002F017C1F